MTTLAIVLKDEIRRLARKEVKAQTGRTARAVVQYRRQIAALKRQILEQDRKIHQFTKRERIASPTTDNLPVDDSTRFSARSVRAQRRRTGLSAADYAQLVGVSPLTIYNWEHGKSRPRAGQFKSLVALRGIGRREALNRLQDLSTHKRTSGRVVRRKPK